MAKDSHGDHPKLAELKAMVRDGRIDTLIVALTDMQGRLMGKRVQGQAFLPLGGGGRSASVTTGTLPGR